VEGRLDMLTIDCSERIMVSYANPRGDILYPSDQVLLKSIQSFL
jgi:hypothetical protein